VHADVGLTADVAPAPGGALRVTARAERLAWSVVVEAPGFRADDDWFHLAPGRPHALLLRPLRPGAVLSGRLRALNARRAAPLGMP
jgi:beta-mannosidase